MLGRLYMLIYTFEFPGFETALDKSIAYAEKGVHLNPDNQRARVILGFVRMACNEMSAALVETEKALALNPRSLLMLDLIGYSLTLLGQWDRGPAIIRKAMQLNPYYHNHSHHALWLDWIRQEQYEKAHLETLNYRTPSLFWVPLMKAATYSFLGRYDEGRRESKNLLKLKPDFNNRGRVLIKHYIKFDDIVERLIESLNKVDLTIE